MNLTKIGLTTLIIAVMLCGCNSSQPGELTQINTDTWPMEPQSVNDLIPLETWLYAPNEVWQGEIIDGKLLLLLAYPPLNAEYNKTLSYFDLATGKELQSIAVQTRQQFGVTKEGLIAVFYPDGVLHYYNKNLELVDSVDLGVQNSELFLPAIKASTIACQLSNDGTQILLISKDGMPLIYDIEKNTITEYPLKPVGDLLFSDVTYLQETAVPNLYYCIARNNETFYDIIFDTASNTVLRYAVNPIEEPTSRKIVNFETAELYDDIFRSKYLVTRYGRAVYDPEGDQSIQVLDWHKQTVTNYLFPKISTPILIAENASEYALLYLVNHQAYVIRGPT